MDNIHENMKHYFRTINIFMHCDIIFLTFSSQF